MNRYHRYLDLESFRPRVNFSKVQTGDMKWLEFHKTLTLDQLRNPGLVRLLKSLGMTSYWIEVFYTPPGQDGIIHSDNTEWQEWAKIVFQYGAKGSTMRWWTSTYVADLSTSIDQIPGEDIPEILDYRVMDRTTDHYHGRIMASRVEDATLQYEAEIGSSSLVNVGALHSSHNPTDDKRFVITVALFDLKGNRILWDDALHRLSRYIIDRPKEMI
jgi:hypothetical protein